MALTSPQNLNYGFFKKSVAGSIFGKRDETPVIVNVGGAGDCGFLSVVAAMLDRIPDNPRLSAEWLNLILARHVKYFPEHRPTLPGLFTATEKIQQLIKQVKMSELLPALAYTLRQLAVSEMCKHPALYRGAFVLQNEGTSPEEMRKPSTWIDGSSIAALAKALNIQIEVQVVDRVKTLPLRLRFGDTGTQPVVIQLQNGHYMPKVHHSEFFSSIKSQPLHPPEPIVVHEPDRSLSDILADIDAADRRLVENFESTYNRLATMVIAGELNQDDLLMMYVKGMATSDYLSGRATCVTVEHGNQQFFDVVNRAQGRIHKGSVATGDHNQRIIDELVHALARSISIGQMSADEVFALVDKANDDSTLLRVK